MCVLIGNTSCKVQTEEIVLPTKGNPEKWFNPPHDLLVHCQYWKLMGFSFHHLVSSGGFDRHWAKVRYSKKKR